MEKIIKVDLNNEQDLIEKYNNDKVSKSLIEYLIKEVQFIDKKNKLKIIVNNNCQTKLDYKKMLYTAFKEEYNNTIREHDKTNIIQLIFFIAGVFFIFLSFKMQNELWKELFLIGGWVPLWEMIDLAIFNDVRGMKRRKNLLKLINSEIV